jgi:hypothetical protein
MILHRNLTGHLLVETNGLEQCRLNDAGERRTGEAGSFPEGWIARGSSESSLREFRQLHRLKLTVVCLLELRWRLYSPSGPNRRRQLNRRLHAEVSPAVHDRPFPLAVENPVRALAREK